MVHRSREKRPFRERNGRERPPPSAEGLAKTRPRLAFLRALGLRRIEFSRGAGGGGGIRTHGTVSRTHAFQAGALSHSATPPTHPPLAGAGGFFQAKDARTAGAARSPPR